MATLLAANKLAKRAQWESHTPLRIHAHKDPCLVTFSDASWMTRKSCHSQGGHLVFMADTGILQGRECPLSLISWNSSRLARVARSTSAAEVQAAADADDEMLYVRLAMYEILRGHYTLSQWGPAASSIPAALVLDCRGVYDALARSESACLGLKDRKSGLEALALKQSLQECRTSLRWCHSAAQLADVMTKDTPESRAPWELLTRRKYMWKLVYDPTFTAARKRTKAGYDVLDYLPKTEPSESQ